LCFFQSAESTFYHPIRLLLSPGFLSPSINYSSTPVHTFSFLCSFYLRLGGSLVFAFSLLYGQLA
jgi:hypothetical protein